MAWRGNTTITDRIFACLPYLLVLFAAYPFKGSLFRVFPILQTVLSPLIKPVDLLYLFASVIFYPVGGLVIFFGLLIFVVRNEKIKHFIRFNTMQALLMTILLTLAGLVLDLISKAGIFDFLVSSINILIFLSALTALIYVVVQSARGLYAELPTISEAVHSQVR